MFRSRPVRAALPSSRFPLRSPSPRPLAPGRRGWSVDPRTLSILLLGVQARLRRWLPGLEAIQLLLSQTAGQCYQATDAREGVRQFTFHKPTNTLQLAKPIKRTLILFNTLLFTVSVSLASQPQKDFTKEMPAELRRTRSKLGSSPRGKAAKHNHLSAYC